MKSLFEQMGGTYTLQGDYYLPDQILSTERETKPQSNYPNGMGWHDEQY